MPLKSFMHRGFVRAILLPGASVLAAFLVTGLLAWIAGADPLRAFYVIGEGAFGNLYVTGSTLVKATTLSLTGLAVGFAYRAGLLNIGAEGQLQMGAAASAATAIYVPAPGPLLMILSVAAGFVAGAAWSGIAGVLRAVFKSNEIVTTLMLNYIALLDCGVSRHRTDGGEGSDFPHQREDTGSRRTAHSPQWYASPRGASDCDRRCSVDLAPPQPHNNRVRTPGDGL